MLKHIKLSMFKNVEIANIDKCWNHQHLTTLVILRLINVSMKKVDKHFESKHRTCLHFQTKYQRQQYKHK